MKFKFKRWEKLVFVFLLAVILMAGRAYAPVTNGSVSISGSTGTYRVLDHNGSVITPNPESNSPSNFLFFNSSPAPNASATTFTPSAYEKYTSAGGFSVYRYDFAGTGNVYVLVNASDGIHYTIIISGNYYTGTAWAPSPLALSGTEAKDYFVSGQTDYMKRTPYAPSAISVTESQERLGDTRDMALTLNVNITADNGSGVNKRQIADVGGTRSYALFLYKVGETAGATVRDGSSFTDVAGPVLIRSNSSSITIKGSYLVAGQSYRLVAWNRNWWTQSLDQPSTFTDGVFGGDTSVNYRGKSWTTLSGGILTPQSYVLTLESKVGDPTPGPGINSFSMPFAPPWYVHAPAVPISEITNASSLVRAINNVAGANVVSSFGEWDKTNQRVSGRMVRYNTSSLNDLNADDAVALSAAIVQGQGYQVYVNLPGPPNNKVMFEIRNTGSP